MQAALISHATGHGDLERARANARTLQPSGIDLVADGDIEPHLGGGGPPGTGEAVIEQGLRHPCGQKRVLLRWWRDQILGRGDGLEREVRMALDQARHERHALAIDNLAAALRDLSRHPGDRADPVALDEDFAIERRSAAGVPDSRPYDDRLAHRALSLRRRECLLRYLTTDPST